MNMFCLEMNKCFQILLFLLFYKHQLMMYHIFSIIYVYILSQIFEMRMQYDFLLITINRYLVYLFIYRCIYMT